MSTANYRVAAAIADSIREDRSVDLCAKLDSQEWVDLANALAALADDWAEAFDKSRGYWGADEDGDHWRIVLMPESCNR